MTIQRLTHLGICVSDLERSLAFYRDVLGFVEVGRLEPDASSTSRLLGFDCTLQAVYLERDGWRIELLHYPTPGHTGSNEPRPMNRLGLTHLSFRVQDIDRVLEKLETAGGRVLGITALGDTVAAAQKRAYEAVEKITFDGAQYRKDIAFKAIDRTFSDS